MVFMHDVPFVLCANNAPTPLNINSYVNDSYNANESCKQDKRRVRVLIRTFRSLPFSTLPKFMQNKTPCTRVTLFSFSLSL